MTHLLNCKELAGHRETQKSQYVGIGGGWCLSSVFDGGKTGASKRGRKRMLLMENCVSQGVCDKNATGFCVFCPSVHMFVYVLTVIVCVGLCVSDVTKQMLQVLLCLFQCLFAEWAVLKAANTVHSHSDHLLRGLLGLPYAVCPQAVAAIWFTNKSHLKVCPNFYTQRVSDRTQFNFGCIFKQTVAEVEVD